MKKDRWDDIQILLDKKQWQMVIKSQRPQYTLACSKTTTWSPFQILCECMEIRQINKCLKIALILSTPAQKTSGLPPNNLQVKL